MLNDMSRFFEDSGHIDSVHKLVCSHCQHGHWTKRNKALTLAGNLFTVQPPSIIIIITCVSIVFSLVRRFIISFENVSTQHDCQSSALAQGTLSIYICMCISSSFQPEKVYCWTYASLNDFYVDRLETACIERLPTFFTRSTVCLVGGGPTIYYVIFNYKNDR